MDGFFNTALRVATVHLVTPDSLILLSWQQCLLYFMFQKSKSQDIIMCSMTFSCLLSWLAGLLSMAQYAVLMTTFLHWSLVATRELHQLCRYIAEQERWVWYSLATRSS